MPESYTVSNIDLAGKIIKAIIKALVDVYFDLKDIEDEKDRSDEDNHR